MKGSGKKLSLMEIVVLGIVLIAISWICYSQFFSGPIDKQIEAEHNEQKDLNTQLTALKNQVAEMRANADEIERIKKAGMDIRMPSYSAETSIMAFIKDALPYTDTHQDYKDLTRIGDQVRRVLSIDFTTDTYEEMEKAVERMCNSRIRCLLDEVSCTMGKSRPDWDSPEVITYKVQIKCTFYETMFDGEDDGRLPVDKSAEE